MVKGMQRGDEFRQVRHYWGAYLVRLPSASDTCYTSQVGFMSMLCQTVPHVFYLYSVIIPSWGEFSSLHSFYLSRLASAASSWQMRVTRPDLVRKNSVPGQDVFSQVRPIFSSNTGTSGYNIRPLSWYLWIRDSAGVNFSSDFRSGNQLLAHDFHRGAGTPHSCTSSTNGFWYTANSSRCGPPRVFLQNRISGRSRGSHRWKRTIEMKVVRLSRWPGGCRSRPWTRTNENPYICRDLEVSLKQGGELGHFTVGEWISFDHCRKTAVAPQRLKAHQATWGDWLMEFHCISTAAPVFRGIQNRHDTEVFCFANCTVSLARFAVPCHAFFLGGGE